MGACVRAGSPTARGGDPCDEGCTRDQRYGIVVSTTTNWRLAMLELLGFFAFMIAAGYIITVKA